MYTAIQLQFSAKKACDHFVNEYKRYPKGGGKKNKRMRENIRGMVRNNNCSGQVKSRVGL